MDKAARVLCWDSHYSGDDLRALAVSHRDIGFTAAWPAGRFNLLLLLDVLEHVDDDRGFLSTVVAELADANAHALVTVPAWQWAFSRRDTKLGHFHRYWPGECRALLKACRLQVVTDGGLFHALLPMRAISVALDRLRGSRVRLRRIRSRGGTGRS